MKHQGEYGFTYDSEAEEWLHWAASCAIHAPALTSKADVIHRGLIACYLDEYLCERHDARHSPAQPQNTCETGQPTGGQGKIALLWLVSAIVAGAVTIAALFIF